MVYMVLVVYAVRLWYRGILHPSYPPCILLVSCVSLDTICVYILLMSTSNHVFHVIKCMQYHDIWCLLDTPYIPYSTPYTSAMVVWYPYSPCTVYHRIHGTNGVYAVVLVVLDVYTYS